MSEKSDIIRAFLPGLPDTITDSVIDIIIANSKDLDNALLTVCDSAASIAVDRETESSVKLGSLAITTNSNKDAEQWMAIKDNFLKRMLVEGTIIIDPTDKDGVVDYGMTLTGADIPLETFEGEFHFYPTERPE